MKKRILVTGASGHIGYHVAALLIRPEHEVILLIRKKNLNIIRLEQQGAIAVTADLQQPASYRELMQNADVLFHLAAENTTDTSDPERVIGNTFGLTRKVLDTAVAGGIKTIVYTSSVVVLGRSPDPKMLITEKDRVSFPESPYVKGKLLAEEYCDRLIAEKEADIRRLYPSWVTGGNDRKLTPPHKVISSYLEKGQVFYFKGGISVADVDEVAKAHVSAWQQGEARGKYIVAGANLSFREFYAILAEHSGRKPPFLYIPKWIIYPGSIAAKMLFGKKSPVDPGYVKSVIGCYSWYDSGKAVRELGYSIRPASGLLSRAIASIKRNTLGTDALMRKNDPHLKRAVYEPDDLLLITGVPGWLGNRMLDVFMNGDRFGNNALNRRIRVLIQPVYKDLVTLPAGIEVAYGDITDKDSLKAALKDVRTVYHLAGAIYPKAIRTLYEVNEQGTRHLVDAAIEQGTRRIIFMGTDSICGYGRKQRIFDEHTPAKPYKNYGRSKYLAEKYILDKTAEGKIDSTSLRGFWFFGPYMPERNRRFFRMFYWKRQVVFGNGRNYRSISHVDNIIQAFVKAEKSRQTIGRWYWIGNKKADHTVDNIYKNIAESLQVSYKPFYIPGWICRLFSILDSAIALSGRLNATLHAAGKFHRDIAGEIAAAERDFDYRPDAGFEEIKKDLNELTD